MSTENDVSFDHLEDDMSLEENSYEKEQRYERIRAENTLTWKDYEDDMSSEENSSKNTSSEENLSNKDVSNKDVFLKIVEDSSVLKILHENESITYDKIYTLPILKGINIEILIKLYSGSYSFNLAELISLIKSLSFLDCKKLREVLLYTKIIYSSFLSHEYSLILDDNILKELNDIVVDEYDHYWMGAVKYGSLELY